MVQIFDMSEMGIVTGDSNLYTGRFNFDLLDSRGQVVGTIREPKEHIWKTVFKYATGQAYSGKHFMHLDDMNGEPLLAVDKHNELFGTSAGILLPNAGPLGGVNKTGWNPVKPHFQIIDTQRNLLADILTIPLGRATMTWNFRVIDPQGVEIAQMLSSNPITGLTGPGDGLLGGLTLRINYRLPDPLRVLVVGAFITISWFKEEFFAN